MSRIQLAIALTVCLLASGVAEGRGSVPLPTPWRVQPATAPEVAPKDNDWGTTSTRDWRGGAENAKGTTWAKTAPRDINSLWYEQTVAIPADWAGQRIVLDFPRIEGDAIVFLNGTRVMELQRPGGEVDLTAQAQAGKDNVLRVFLTRDYTGISRGFKQDSLRYLSRSGDNEMPMPNWPTGITAPVTMYSRPRPAAITDVFAISSWRQKTLTLEVEVQADTPQEGLTLAGTVLDKDGKPALTIQGAAFSAPAGRSVQRISAPWANPIPWELEAGYVYTAQVALLKAGAAADQAPEIKFGFREIWEQGKDMYLNGHLMRWRMAMPMGFDKNNYALGFYHLLGYNALEFQPNPTAWWRDWSETPIENQSMLDALDNMGMVALLPAPGITYLRSAVVDDAHVRADYTREMNLHLRRLRNHPSVMAWSIGMNMYCPRENQWPAFMGHRAPDNTQSRFIDAACAIAKSVDPTRFAYAHADGGTGDLATSNLYLNFAPLQEREEWPMAWAQSGEMPYSAVEFGEPYTANFWKGKRMLLTEYTAMYFGDKAYADEGEAGLQKSLDYSLMNTSGHGAMGKVDLAQYPIYWDFQRLFVRQTNRSWRTWGINAGWLYWNLDTQYGDPPAFTAAHRTNRFDQYSYLTEPVTTKPAWANPNFEIHQQANQALLVYLGGAPRHTDKTHAYYAGEKIDKQIVVIWDGPGTKKFQVEWALSALGAPDASGKVDVEISSGETKFFPISMTAPAITGRSKLLLDLTVREGDKETFADQFVVEIFPQPAAQKVAGTFALYDPAGKSAWVKTLGAKVTDWKPGDTLNGVDLLVIGREALKPGAKLPYTAADLQKGVRVLILEQQPAIWEGLGLKSIETMPRYVFARDRQSDVLAGLQAEDLINWRGTPDLWPEGKPARGSETQHAPKWTNTHAVASCALQIPAVVGFTPLLDCEFDENFSPLLKWQTGTSTVYFSSLDLTGRVGVDPAATLLARNLLKLAAAKAPATRQTEYINGAPVKGEVLEPLQINLPPGPAVIMPHADQSLYIVGDTQMGLMEGAVQQGAHVLVLPQTAAALEGLGYKTEQAPMSRFPLSDSPLLRGVGPSELRFREPTNLTFFAATGQPAGCTVLGGGAFLVRQQGKGLWLFTQLSPALFANRYPDEKDADKRLNLELTQDRQAQLLAQLLTNLGATPSAQQVQRLTTLTTGLSYDTLSQWQVLGPYRVDHDDGDVMLNTKFLGEDAAITGNTSPVGEMRWQAVRADENGKVDLGAALGPSELAVGYVTRMVHSDRARDAVLALGVDYRLAVWVNGELVFRTVSGRTRAAGFSVKIPLKAGDNVISMKIGSGSKGFAFWASLSADTGESPDQAKIKQTSLYTPSANTFDPYEFYYW